MIKLAFILSIAVCAIAPARSQPAVTVSPEWSNIRGVSKTHVSIQVCPEPPLRRGYPIHDQLFRDLQDLDVDYARLQPWDVYPKLAIAELRAPNGGKTFWDFSFMDPIVEDFMRATQGHPVIFDIGAMPRWMFTMGKPKAYPENPDEIDWSPYTDGRKVNAATAKLFAEYQARLVSWYTKGGFHDEYGQWHASNHYYRIDYWEVINEPNAMVQLTAPQYTKFYDAVVRAVRAVAPRMKFAGPADGVDLEFLGYFLDPKNHAPGISIDWLTYHVYSDAVSDETPEIMEHTIFEQADRFLTSVRDIDAVRKRLSPHTGTAIDELGSGLSGLGGGAFSPPSALKPIPPSYWNLAGAMWAYMFGNLAVLGIDAVHAAELIDYPGQVAASSLTDWNTGKPRANYWVVKLLHDNIRVGDRIVQPLAPADESKGPNPAIQIYAQGFVSAQGGKKLLLVNKRNRPITVSLPGITGGTVSMVDQSTHGPPQSSPVTSDTIPLNGLAVAVVTWPRDRLK